MISPIDPEVPMLALRKSKPVTASSKGGRNSMKMNRKQKGEFKNLLGSKWSEEELVYFYEAYRKLGDDWVKVAAMVGRQRTKEMVETLYNMNKVYLSLPEGAATLGGFISIMSDRYDNFLEGGQREEQEASPGSAAKNDNIVGKRGGKSNKGSKRRDPSRVSQTHASGAKRLKIKLGGKVFGTTEGDTDSSKRNIGFEIPSNADKLRDQDPEVLRKRFFGDDERISLVCEALLELSRGEPLNRDETGAEESLEKLKEGNSVVASEDKKSTTVPEASDELSLRASGNAFPEVDEHPQPPDKPVQNSLEPMAEVTALCPELVKAIPTSQPEGEKETQRERRLVDMQIQRPRRRSFSTHPTVKRGGFLLGRCV